MRNYFTTEELLNDGFTQVNESIYEKVIGSIFQGSEDSKYIIVCAEWSDPNTGAFWSCHYNMKDGELRRYEENILESTGDEAFKSLVTAVSAHL